MLMNTGIVVSFALRKCRSDEMRLPFPFPFKELVLVFVVAVVAFLAAIGVAIVFDGLRPAKLLIDQGEGQVLEVDEE